MEKTYRQNIYMIFIPDEKAYVTKSGVIPI